MNYTNAYSNADKKKTNTYSSMHLSNEHIYIFMRKIKPVSRQNFMVVRICCLIVYQCSSYESDLSFETLQNL